MRFMTAIILSYMILAFTTKSVYGQEKPSSQNVYEDLIDGERWFGSDAVLQRDKKLNSLRPSIEKALREQKLGHLRVAEAMYRKILADFPHEHESSANLAAICFIQGKLDESLARYLELVYPENFGSSIGAHSTTLMRYVLALLMDNQWSAAIEVYNKGLTQMVSPRGLVPIFNVKFEVEDHQFVLMETMAHLHLGMVSPSWARPDPKDMKMHLLKAMQLTPNNARIILEYGKHLDRYDRNYAAAENAFKQAALLGSPEIQEQAHRYLDLIVIKKARLSREASSDFSTKLADQPH